MIHARTSEHKRALARLAYFRKLLAAALAHARGERDGAESLRRERVRLDIHQPDLDVMPLWSRRVDPDRVELPCASFIAEQVLAALEVLDEMLGAAAPAARRVLERWVVADPAARGAAGQPGRLVPVRDLEMLAAPDGPLASGSGFLDRSAKSASMAGTAPS